MRVLVICRPGNGVDASTQIMPLADEEMAALRALKSRGLLLEAYSPGGPGAVLMFEGARADVEAAVATLPMVRAGVISAAFTELHPFAALGPD